MKLSGPRAFRPVMMMVVAVVVASFFAASDATSGRSKPSGSLGCSNSLLESSDVLVGYSDGRCQSSDICGRSTLVVQRPKASDVRNRDVA
jgi:hypothetical protein